MTQTHLRTWNLMMNWRDVVDRVDRDVQKAAGINVNTLLVLRALVETPDCCLTMNELATCTARTIGLSRSAISRLAAQMERASLVKPDYSPEGRYGEDRRTRTIVLGDAGVTAYKAAWPAYIRAIEMRFARYVDERSVGTVLSTVELVLNSAGDETSSTGTM